MLLTRYDLYDLYAVLVAVKRAPEVSYNARIFSVLDALFLSDGAKHAEPNVIRLALREIAGLDRDHFGFVFVNNKYTYGQTLLTDAFGYRVLQNTILELVRCAESKNAERLSDLAAATCRIPLLLADKAPFLRHRVRRACAPYKRKYKEDLYKAIVK